ncbi:hypothetical protein U1701_18470 [Sphingomonas sp. PB2P19]|uniref:hypothetical protein n=1 Tax=Sphingomonas rhamnosi TaxID=3096156 RepID=UPI002FC8F04E
MSDRDVWEKAAAIVAEFGDDDPEHFSDRLADILRDTADPKDWRRVAAAVDAIVDAREQ